MLVKNLKAVSKKQLCVAAESGNDLISETKVYFNRKKMQERVILQKLNCTNSSLCLLLRPAPKNEDEMMVAIFEYIDRLFNIVRPRRVLYMAIDGVVSY